jgi:putative membrane protein
MKSKRFRFLLCGGLAALLPVSAAQAAQDSTTAWHPTSFLEAVVASIVFGAVGVALAVGGFKLFDLVTPFNLEKEMCQNKNIAVGILCGAIVLGICHIIAASMS